MEANKENQQSIEQAFEQALDAYKAGNFAEAAGQWLALAEDGCAPAQRALGSLYERGQGVEKNAANAFEWTKKAAEQNDPVAMFNLACYHDKGFGVKKNQQTALTWYRKAAEYGHPEAAALIASLIETGDRGLEKDMDEAVRWYQIAANRGNVLAMGRLAWLYSTGTGVPQDAAFAFQYFLKAAQGGKVGTSICEPDQFRTALDILKKAEELNVKSVEFSDDEEALVRRSAKANFKVLGSRLGKNMKEAAAKIQALTGREIGDVLAGKPYKLVLADGTEAEITAEDLVVQREEKPGLVAASENGITIALATELTPELEGEGFARELVSKIQNLRKEKGFDVTDRIRVVCSVPEKREAALEANRAYICEETLAVAFKTARKPM